MSVLSWRDGRNDAGGIYAQNISFSGAFGPLLWIKQVSSNIPVESKLLQNYPNPFNPKTNISFQLAVNSFAALTIYDIAGREVEILLKQQLNPGTYEVTFDAMDFSSGVYFYRLIAGNFVDTRKLIVAK
jgi:hypothetical protein